jgi:ribose transport system permease protein
MKKNPTTAMLTQYAGMASVLAILIVMFSTLSDSFLTTRTMTTIANQIPDLTVVAVGMTLVLVVGGIDLSVGSVLAVGSAVLSVLMLQYGWPIWMAVPMCLLSGAICGLINGLITVCGRIPSFIVTLGMLEIARGAAYLITDSNLMYVGSPVAGIATPISGLGISPAFLIAIATVLAGQFLLSFTVFGRYCVAIGTNAETVRMSGIRAAPYSIMVFTICGLMCGLGGWMRTAKLNGAHPNTAIGLELAAIAACVIGGTSLMGGRGSVISTFFGVLIITVLQTGLDRIGASEPTKRIITGVVIIIAVLLDTFRQKWATRNP